MKILFLMIFAAISCFEFASIEHKLQSIAITEALDTIRIETNQRVLEDKLNRFGAGLIELKQKGE